MKAIKKVGILEKESRTLKEEVAELKAQVDTVINFENEIL